MSRYLNRVTLLGCVSGTPSLSDQQNGSQTVSFWLSTQARRRDPADGQVKALNEQYRILITQRRLVGSVMALCAQGQLIKGMRVYIEGEFVTDSFEGPDGVARVMKVVELAGDAAKMIRLDETIDKLEGAVA